MSGRSIAVISLLGLVACAKSAPEVTEQRLQPAATAPAAAPAKDSHEGFEKLGVDAVASLIEAKKAVAVDANGDDTRKEYGTLPGAVLRLGQDVAGEFPPSLVRLADPELTAFLATIDPTPDSTRDSGTMDWAVLPDRMHFIADLFRTRHEDVTLFESPFTQDQLRDIAAGRVSDGAL